MSLPALDAAMLFAGLPMNSGSLPPQAPAALSCPALRDQDGPVADAMPGEVSAVNAPAPEPKASDDRTEIVVTAHPRHVAADPLQEVNALSFKATQAVDRAFVRPVALAYSNTVPKPIRSGIRNFLSNLTEPGIFLNFLLQLKPGKAARTFGRFAVNSTIGGAGLFDMAKRRAFKLPYRPNGFADTMGYYGVKPGAFLFLPIIGPTTIRDVLGLGLDRLVMPTAVGTPFNQPAYSIPSGTLTSLDQRAQLDEALQKLHESSDGPYAATRADYLHKRQAEIDNLRRKRRDLASLAPQSIGPAPAEK